MSIFVQFIMMNEEFRIEKRDIVKKIPKTSLGFSSITYVEDLLSH